jgi:ribonuclease G
VAFELVRELMKVSKKTKSHKVYVYAHPEVSAELSHEEMNIIESIEEMFQKNVVIRSENNYHIEQYEIYAQEF